jgi:adenylosuccinate lyase
MLSRFTGVVRNLVVSPERMMANLESTRGTIFSGHLLLALVDRGMTREEAYALVQRHAIAAFDGGATLLERVNADTAVTAVLSAADIAELFNVQRFLREVDRIVDRALA